MRILIVMGLLLIPTCMCAQSYSPHSTVAGMRSLRSLFDSNAVAKVQVLHMPDSVSTRVAVTQQALRSVAITKKTFRDRVGQTLDQMLAGISVKGDKHTPDLRWGVLLYNAKNHEVASVFVDKFGRYGYLNGKTVSFDAGTSATDLAKRLHQITGIRD
jgi:hypothetical protein